MNYLVLLLAGIAIIYILFGLYILIKRRADPISWTFFAFSLSVATWNLSITLIEGKIFDSKEMIILLDRASYFSVPFMAMTIIFYIIGLKEAQLIQALIRNKMVKFLSVLGVINLLLIPTDLISKNQGEVGMSVGPLMPFLGAFIAIAAVYITYLCYVGWKTTEGDVKTHYKYVVYGFSLTAIGSLIFNVALPILGYNAYPMFGAASAIFIVWFMGLGVIGTTVVGAAMGMVGGIIASMFIAIVISLFALSLMFILFAALFGNGSN